jgi:4-alpha-glucanotransferase
MDISAPTERFPRAAGILLHPTCLPGGHGMGDLGFGTSQFLDFLTRSGMHYWQILPLSPPGPGNSPYSATSSFSGNPWLIDLGLLQKAGLLKPEDLEPPRFPLDHVDFDRMKSFKGPLLQQAAARLIHDPSHAWYKSLHAFLSAQSWIHDDALFHVLRDHYGKPWWEWDAEIRVKDPAACRQAQKVFADEIKIYEAIQFFFDMQWRMVQVQASDLGVHLFGDLPIYVAHDSVDVWANRNQFLLDAHHQPTVISGAPPDPFSETGQLWGNPIYDWERMRSDGHAFWCRRMQQALARTPMLRLDHFRGFSAYWAAPPDAPDARSGQFFEGPGVHLFNDLKDTLGNGKLVAEDLGVLDDDVYRLLDEVKMPGMRVLQFAFGSESINIHLPHQHTENVVAYTGTHDNPPTLGWWHDTAEHVRDHVRRYCSVNGDDVVWDLIRSAMQSVAHTMVVPMQDILALGNNARMNVPGQELGNWNWRVREEAFSEELANRVCEATGIYNRDPLKRAREESLTRVASPTPNPWHRSASTPTSKH